MDSVHNLTHSQCKARLTAYNWMDSIFVNRSNTAMLFYSPFIE